MATINVSDLKQLYSALASCKGGETILLAGGDYGNMNLSVKSGFNFAFPSNVTIMSADARNPASFSAVEVRGAANMTFDGIKFDYEFQSGDLTSERPFNFQNCTNLTIRNSTFDGDFARGVSSLADGYGYGIGLSVRTSTGVTVENCESYDFHRGMVFSENSGVTVRNNEVYGMRSDGMDFSEVQNVVIEGNHIHDFRAPPASTDHRDMIQFWTSGTDAPTENVVIRDNLLDIGNGARTQSIFMRNEVVDTGRAGASMYYQNILIENNTITNASARGISVGETNGLVIRNNSVLHADGAAADGPDPSVEIPKIMVAENAKNVVISANLAADIPSAEAGWTVTKNILVQDQDSFAPNYYNDVFVSSSLALRDGEHRYLAVAGGVIDQANAGSDVTQGAGGGLQVQFQVAKVDGATRVFDASHSVFDGGSLPVGTAFYWTFGDGTKAQGVTVRHSYSGPGDYPVKLTIKLPTGATVYEDYKCSIQSSEVLSLQDGHFVAYHDGAPVDLGVAPKLTSDGIQLGAVGVTATIDRNHVLDVIGSDKMTIGMTLDADKVGTSGEVFRLHGSFTAAVTSTGEMSFQVFRDGGLSPVTVMTKGARLNSVVEKDHDVVIHLDSGKLQIWVDGALAGQTTMSGTIGGATGYNVQDLVFGNPWKKGNFVGDLSAFEMSVSAGFPASPKTTILKTAQTATTASDAGVLTVSSAMEHDSGQHDASSALDHHHQDDARYDLVTHHQGHDLIA
ncbi:right-handed parallel beta-helix repeat-containing protein [Rubellimicrobium arenae]|uniref:right-handed parallel beta-helix repeat-containing protein n=1 Tax=Rubellimicrobium arenae TaxID=2817372 RepID=UPI001B305EC8|nr:right-handed parallel beta-helix repeat-containing protein [Rubellimicrobium arenae]